MFVCMVKHTLLVCHVRMDRYPLHEHCIDYESYI
jgi:hypothetical protein